MKKYEIVIPEGFTFQADRKCPICGKSLALKRKDSKYCSPRCGSYASSQRPKVKERIKKYQHEYYLRVTKQKRRALAK